jgi:hypothetical protein
MHLHPGAEPGQRHLGKDPGEQGNYRTIKAGLKSRVSLRGLDESWEIKSRETCSQLFESTPPNSKLYLMAPLRVAGGKCLKRMCFPIMPESH